VVAATVLVVLVLFLVRPGANRLRIRIVNSISLALGRPVEVASVSLRLLPEPGFDLRNFVVHEDPAFGAEPTLQAGEVTATLRVSSLLRGRLEIARLTLTEPSLNLVQDGAGHWNLENLLERADRIPIAPTSKRKTEIRPGFPYIEADRGRINFKLGQEKKPYALTDADFSLWQDSEDTWGMRLRAQPVRTDFNLSDTGTVEVQGSWQRAAALRDTPLQFSLQWEGGQLGQVTKLAYGSDAGWRGTIAISATLKGTPVDLAVQSNASVEDFRRYDLAGGGALRLAAQCSGRYSSVDHSWPSLSCQAPIGGGFLNLDGSLGGLRGSGPYDLAVVAQNVPMQSLVALARHAKRDIPDDLAATGTLDAAFQLKRNDQSRETQVAWTGGGQTRGFGLESRLANTQLVLGKVPFSLSWASGSWASGSVPEVVNKRGRPGLGTTRNALLPHLEVGPFNLALERPAPATVHAWFSRSDYRLQIEGDAEIQRLLQLGRIVGLPVSQPAADGLAKVDLQIVGNWSAFTPARTLGKAQLRSVRAEIRGLNEPLKIASANLVFMADEVEVENIVASVAGTGWRGSVVLPQRCVSPGPCAIHFDLHADTIATDTLSELLDPHPHTRPWYRFLSSAPRAGTPYLLTLRAAGQLVANQVAIHNLVAKRVSANVDLEDGKLRLSNLQGEVLGGQHTGEWKADFTAKPAAYSGSGSLQGVALGQLAQAMHDDWITGTATATYQATAAGLSAAELISSANATLQVETLDGTLPHIALASTGPLHMRSFAGRLLLQDGKFEVQEGELDTPEGIYQVSGTASLGRILNLKLVRAGAHGFNITGPLTDPHVAEAGAPDTRAALKP